MCVRTVIFIAVIRPRDEGLDAVLSCRSAPR
jgi:hypothetical protein